MPKTTPEVTKEWTPDGMVDVAAPDTMDGGTIKPVAISSASGQPLKRTLNKNTRKPGIYNRIITIDGLRFFVLSVSDEDAQKLLDTDNAFNEANKAGADLIAVNKLTLDRQQIYYDVLKNILAGWDLPDDDGSPWPCTPENIECLDFEDAVRVVGNAMARQLLGPQQGNG